jgi:hypothetical protein
MVAILRPVALLALVLPVLEAVQPARIPPFELTGLDGQVKLSDRLGLNGQWLLVVVQSGCRPCDGLLQLVKKREDHPNMVPRMVIIGSMPLGELKKLALRFPNLTGAKWFADPGKNAARQLKLAGAPVVAGVKLQTMVWTMNGVANANRTRSTMLSWTK